MTSAPEWLDPIGSKDERNEVGVVHSALFTTYDPPDATLLVEDLLPLCFKMNRESSSDDVENRFFLADLESELQRRRGNLAIFASAAFLGAESQHWIWSHVTRHFVGARGPVVQHAKLVMLQRVDETGIEYLEIGVSSMNLTRSALRDQVQAGFRLRVVLSPKPSERNLRRWGMLVPFLQELGSHSGPQGVAAVAPWLNRLARCQCPEDTPFIASVPGRHHGTQWGVRALGAALHLPTRGEVDIFVPTVGAWTTQQILAWVKIVGTRPNRVGLAWVPRGHPWAKHWTLPSKAVVPIEKSGVVLLALSNGHNDERRRLHPRFSSLDMRWPHAKVYWFERGSTSRVLITSANWSPSAWGVVNGKDMLTLKNFELGVLIRAAKRPFRALRKMTSIPATVMVEREEAEAVPWAHAAFDGRRLTINILKDQTPPRKILVVDADNSHQSLQVAWRQADGFLRAVARRTRQSGPSSIIIMLQGRKHWIAVQDLRGAVAALDHPLSRPPGMTDGELKRMRAALLEERYGGQLVENSPPFNDGEKRPSIAVSGAYGLWFLEEARRLLSIVDAWASVVVRTHMPEMRETIARDGRELVRLWKEEGVASLTRREILKIACDELQARLRSIA
jgi:hypothetical protein